MTSARSRTPQAGFVLAAWRRRLRCSARCGGRRSGTDHRDRKRLPLSTRPAPANRPSVAAQGKCESYYCTGSRRRVRPAMAPTSHRDAAAPRGLARPRPRGAPRCWPAPRDRGRSAATRQRGSCSAKYAACSPLPLATSSTRPWPAAHAATRRGSARGCARHGGDKGEDRMLRTSCVIPFWRMRDAVLRPDPKRTRSENGRAAGARLIASAARLHIPCRYQGDANLPWSRR